MRYLLAAFTLALAGAAQAQEAPTPDQMTARVMVAALAPQDYGDWAYGWDAVSIRISRMMHWHLAEPDERNRPADATIRRNGWFSTSGRQVGVSAYGKDDAVTSLSFELDRVIGRSPPTDGVLDALRAEGVTVTPVREREAISERFGPSATYRLTHPKLDGAELIRSTGCTSSKSAAAQQCWVSYELVLGRK